MSTQIRTDGRLRQDDGTETAWQVFGSGAHTLTLIHSLALSGDWFRPLIAELGSQYRVVVPDLRGHGLSQAGEGEISLALLADDIARLWQLLRVSSSDVLGISLGGMVAQALGTRHPDRVDRLVLMATTGGYDEAATTGAMTRAARASEPGGIAQTSELFLERWFGPDLYPQDPLVDRARAEYLSADPAVHAAYLRAMTQVGEFPCDAGIPALVLGAQQDGSTPAPVIEALAAKIPGAELDFVPGAHLTAFTHPEQVAARIRPFLESTNGDDR